jgi:hypothetical protein
MSKIALSGNASGTGTFTISSPNSSTDRTLDLPDAAGTIQVSGNPISGTTGTFTGLVDISAAGAGQIAFPATQNASANANTLDDYEEGTFTPTIVAETPASGTTYSTQVGRYVKIGRMVQIEISINLSSKGAGGSGLVSVSGLPFTSVTVSNNFPNFGIAMAPVTSPAGGQITGQVNSGTAVVQLVFGTNTTSELTAMSYSVVQAPSNIRMSFSYQTT